MKKVFLLVVPVLFAAACNKCDDPNNGIICTQEFRMITLKAQNGASHPVTLDSFYTTRQSNGQRIQSQQQAGPGYYVVLDDSYHAQLKNSEDNFRFVGWKGGQVSIDQVYRIAGDHCHIYKKSGVDSVVVN